MRTALLLRQKEYWPTVTVSSTLERRAIIMTTLKPHLDRQTASKNTIGLINGLTLEKETQNAIRYRLGHAISGRQLFYG